MPPELLNDIGDAPLVKQRSDGAIELFRFNVAASNSAIAYDRPGRAYRTLKQHQPALKSYQKASMSIPIYWNADTAKRRTEELVEELARSKN